MDTRITGNRLFFGAIGDLLSNLGAVLRIGAPWFAIYIALNALAGQRYAHWVIYDIDGFTQPPGEWYLAIVFLVMLGTVAASWHRFKVLGERPGFIPQMRLMIILKYVLAWVVIGIIIGLIVLTLTVVPLFLVGSFIGQTTMTPLMDQWLSWQLWSVYGADPPVAAWMFAAAIALVAILLSILLLFRMGVGLPSVAILDGQGIGMRASWRATRGIAGAVFGASLWATLASMLLYAAVLSASLPLDAEYSTAEEVALRIAVAVMDIVTLLVGTAILTRIYQAVPENLL